MSEVETVKVKSPVSEDNALGFIVINKSDFNEKLHEVFDITDEKTVTPVTRAALDAALVQLPDGQTDPEYVVASMRTYFGELFTEDDEAVVRRLVYAPAAKPSTGLTVDQLKAALTEKNIAIPAEVTKKADLQALLDAAA